MQRLDLVAERALVVHRGRDQIVEIDLLDVEGLAHMQAAGAQKLRHLGLVRLRDRIPDLMASGRVVTWLKASAVARILIRMVFMNRRVSECRPGFVRINHI